MNSNFSRIITLLRKERDLSQKQAANDLQISQALLSHYEKGIRECGLDFVVRAADYYDVSCDYLLGRTPDRSGATLTIDDIPENPESQEKDNSYRGSLLPALNKKLICNSLNVIFDILQKCSNKSLTNEVSSYLMISVYKMFRVLYSSNNKNPQGLFATPKNLYTGFASAAQSISEANAKCIVSGEKVSGLDNISKENLPSLSPEIISEQYPLLASSVYNLIQSSESKMGMKHTGK